MKNNRPTNGRQHAYSSTGSPRFRSRLATWLLIKITLITDIYNTVQVSYNKFQTKPVVIQNYSPTGCPMTDIYNTVQVINKFQNKLVQRGSPAGHAPTTNQTAADVTVENPGTQSHGVQHLDPIVGTL